MGVDVGRIAASLEESKANGVFAGQEDAPGQVAALAYDPVATLIAVDVKVIEGRYQCKI